MAACVAVQLGQCGTQIGHQFFSTLYEDATKSSILASSNANIDYENASLQTFFNCMSDGKREARSVMIDMEPKAVTCALQTAEKNGKNWTYPKNQQFYSRSGSGNNWSFGYKVLAPRCKDDVLNLIRKEVEKCDYFGGFLLFSSLAGGTGSGLGSYITEILKDSYQHAMQVSAVVCPYANGEVAVQNYNAILSLANSCFTTDANILLHNDNLHSICSRLLGIKKVSFNDINNVVANQLASVLQPVTKTGDDVCALSSRYSNVLNCLVSTCASYGQYSMLDLKSLPYIPQASVSFSTYSWDALLKRIYQMLITDFFMDEGLDWYRKLPENITLCTEKYPRYLSNLLLMRGHHALSFQTLPNFQHNCLYSQWIPSLNRCSYWKTNMPFCKFEKSVTLLSNGTPCVEPLDKVVSKAWQMFESRAYFHQYAKHGVEEEDFINAFVAIESVISAYKQI